MYTGKISLTQSNAVDIVKVSDLFELTAVKNTTLKFIEDYISFEVRYNSLIFATVTTLSKFTLIYTLTILQALFGLCNQTPPTVLVLGP